MKYKNENGVIIEVIENNGRYVTYKIGNEAHCIGVDSFENMTRLNNYKEVV